MALAELRRRVYLFQQPELPVGIALEVARVALVLPHAAKLPNGQIVVSDQPR
jgi:hypothetical protein